MLKQLKGNERGIVFITIILILMITMVLAISVASMNISQAVISESEVQRVQAEIIAQGAGTVIFMNQLTASPGLSMTWNQTHGNSTFLINAQRDPSGTGIDGTDVLDITVTY